MRLIRFVLRLVLVVLVLASLAVGMSFVSPWPGVLAMRGLIAWQAAQMSDALAPLAPREVQARLHIAHTPTDPQGRLDLYLPPGEPPAGGWPVVVWVHGGAFVGGDKGDVGNWLRIVAAKGFAAVAPAYSRAPGAVHPAPVRQVNEALAWAVREAATQGLNASRVVLAGDSAGAQIAAQTGIALVDSAYAARLGVAPAIAPEALRGVVLFGGIYDPALLRSEGVFGWFIDTAFWAYVGQQDWRASPMLADFAILSNLRAGMPPLFVSAGNADPLLPQSQALVAAADARGIRAESYFVPADHTPPARHQYQFDLSSDAGKEAFAQMIAFIEANASD